MGGVGWSEGGGAACRSAVGGAHLVGRGSKCRFKPRDGFGGVVAGRAHLRPCRVATGRRVEKPLSAPPSNGNARWRRRRRRRQVGGRGAARAGRRAARIGHGATRGGTRGSTRGSRGALGRVWRGIFGYARRSGWRDHHPLILLLPALQRSRGREVVRRRCRRHLVVVAFCSRGRGRGRGAGARRSQGGGTGGKLGMCLSCAVEPLAKHVG